MAGGRTGSRRSDDGGESTQPDLGAGESDLGKFLLLKVPDYNCDRGGTGPLDSYIRLGAIQNAAIVANPSAPRATGEDLAANITSFIDDTRIREGSPDYVTPADRQAETAKLHTKGGIRMHTDGNMVQTVRGDCAVVIGGNYRMEVLGRDLNGLKTASYDVSGGHVAETGITFLGSSSIEYTTAEYGGTWMVFEETHHAHVTSTYHGKTFERYTGEIVDTITGSEAPTAEHPNPVITDKTWATSITSDTGSSALPVPSISDTTFATTITSATTVTTMTDTTTAGAMISTTTAGAITDTTIAGAIVSTTIGNTVDTTLGTVTSTTIGAVTDVTVGNTFEAVVGAEESITLGAMLDLTLGLIAEICIAGKMSVDLGPRLEISAGPRTEVNIDRTGVHAEKTGVSGQKTDVSASYEVLSAITVFL